MTDGAARTQWAAANKYVGDLKISYVIVKDRSITPLPRYASGPSLGNF